MDKSRKIFDTGHNGMVGSVICRRVQLEGYSNLILHSREKLKLLYQPVAKYFLQNEKLLTL